MARPILYVLGGVNGAGKSSVGGQNLIDAGVTWFNPDSFARELRSATGVNLEEANAVAWEEGMRRLRAAIDAKSNYAFETTLGGSTVTKTLIAAAESHDLYLWYCGLDTAELHIHRVKARVKAGGHDIPEEKIRERFHTSRLNLIKLMPYIEELRVFDNSVDADAKTGIIPDPALVLTMRRGKLRTSRKDLAALKRIADWAKPITEAALRHGASRLPVTRRSDR